MQQTRYQIRFNPPAFLGDAEQSGQWRAPPFKAQLRQWWRVAYAQNHGFRVDVAAMREAEGRLFGHAWLDNDRDATGGKVAARRSAVRLRLEHWAPGKLTKSKWQPLGRVSHRERNTPPTADLYLGYGPLALPRHETNPTLKTNAAIQADERNVFALAYPPGESALLEQALALMDLYGSAGGRSRNGWGSYQLVPMDGTPALRPALPMRSWLDALNLDWPHAIGLDEKGALVWQTAVADDWKPLMKLLADIKIGLRTQFRFTHGKNSPVAEERHWLSYPVTNHSVQAWGNNLRLPNTLRFKIRTTADRKLVGVIFHMPCLPPPAFNPDAATITGVWRRVHEYLDARAPHLNRVDA
jgi:CRISPR-associated protein Cmr1